MANASPAREVLARPALDIPNDPIPLPRLPSALRELTNSEPPDYSRLWRMAVAGKFPTSMIGHRYHVYRADLPAIAAALGMTPTAPQKASRKAIAAKAA